MKIRNSRLLLLTATWIVLHLIPVSYGNATSVREVSMDEMLQKAQFVFEGRVTAIEMKENSQKRIYTYITFEIIDVIKGEYNSKIITLRFLGGTVGDVTLAVSDMRMPREGEHGIYFVESLERTQVNPLYGWSQGHFIVERDVAGVERVMTNGKLPITGVKGGVPEKQITADKEEIQTLSNGISRDVVVSQDGKEDSALTVEDFKKALQERLGKNQ